MEEFLIPTAESETEFTEKRSRFIGHVWRVETEQQARERIEQMKKQYHDARHNCWCYILKDGAVRYSDDGEPQGTAGQPMLNVFAREGIVNVCCVVTRYFGGILLGAGGLVRAYTQSAKDALDAAGISVVRKWIRCEIPCSYAQLETIKREVLDFDGVIDEIAYGEQVTVLALFPQGQLTPFSLQVQEITAGDVQVTPTGETYRDVPLSRK